MTGDKVGPIDQIGRVNRSRAESDVRDGNRPGLFRVIDKIALGVHRRILADDLDGVLGCADGAVRTVAREKVMLRLGDGVVTGYGRVDGRLTYVFAQDFTIFGGTPTFGDAGVPPGQIQEIAGHSSFSTTMRYIRPNAKGKRKAIRALPRLE